MSSNFLNQPISEFSSKPHNPDEVVETPEIILLSEISKKLDLILEKLEQTKK